MTRSDIHRTVVALLMALAVALMARPCTSCVVNGGASRYPILWKHRDTGAPHNFIAHHPATDSTYEYIALHNQSDRQGREAWIGMNRPGLAVMNTASYNLAPDTASVKDREGLVMTRALRHCITVDDFARLLESLPRPMGIQANFGALDAYGHAAYFEACDTGYTRFDIPADSLAIRTNYSHSGSLSGRLGLAREQVATQRLCGKVGLTPCYLTDTLSATFFDPTTGVDYLAAPDTVIADRGNMIPRFISTASIAIEAIPSEQGDGSRYVMWTRLGYPPASQTVAVTLDLIPSDVVPDASGITPAERCADSIKASVFLAKHQGKHHLIDTKKLKKICHLSF